MLHLKIILSVFLVLLGFNYFSYIFGYFWRFVADFYRSKSELKLDISICICKVKDEATHHKKDNLSSCTKDFGKG